MLLTRSFGIINALQQLESTGNFDRSPAWLRSARSLDLSLPLIHLAIDAQDGYRHSLPTLVMWGIYPASPYGIEFNPRR